MSNLLLVVLMVVVPALGWALHGLQAWLERWDYRRHAND